MIPPERMDLLKWCHANETNESETQEWRGDLTDEEQKVVDKWDAEYTAAFDTAMRKIAAHDQRRREQQEQAR